MHRWRPIRGRAVLGLGAQAVRRQGLLFALHGAVTAVRERMVSRLRIAVDGQ